MCNGRTVCNKTDCVHGECPPKGSDELKTKVTLLLPKQGSPKVISLPGSPGSTGSPVLQFSSLAIIMCASTVTHIWPKFCYIWKISHSSVILQRNTYVCIHCICDVPCKWQIQRSRFVESVHLTQLAKLSRKGCRVNMHRVIGVKPLQLLNILFIP